ncbi:hypothetical protein KIPB_010408, partial [Kipferlia bialata]|eukprot:g10408.t1
MAYLAPVKPKSKPRAKNSNSQSSGSNDPPEKWYLLENPKARPGQAPSKPGAPQRLVRHVKGVMESREGKYRKSHEKVRVYGGVQEIFYAMEGEDEESDEEEKCTHLDSIMDSMGQTRRQRKMTPKERQFSGDIDLNAYRMTVQDKTTGAPCEGGDMGRALPDGSPFPVVTETLISPTGDQLRPKYLDRLRLASQFEYLQEKRDMHYSEEDVYPQIFK